MRCGRNSRGSVVGCVLAVAGISIILAVILPSSWRWLIVGVVLLALGLYVMC